MGDREAASRRGKGSIGSRSSEGRRGDVGGSRAGARGSRLLGKERDQSAPFSAVGGQGAGPDVRRRRPPSEFAAHRSAERRVGKVCVSTFRSRWLQYN